MYIQQILTKKKKAVVAIVASAKQNFRQKKYYLVEEVHQVDKSFRWYSHKTEYSKCSEKKSARVKMVSYRKMCAILQHCYEVYICVYVHAVQLRDAQIHENYKEVNENGRT